MNKILLTILIVLFGFNLVGCAARADSPYLVKFGGSLSFLPMLVSGNGRVVVGWPPRATGLAIWTKSGGIKIVEQAPPGQRLLPKAVDRDGDVIVGVLQPTEGVMTDRGIMFRWSQASGLQLITDNKFWMSGVWQMDVSNDGEKVEFFCPDESEIPTCPGSSSAPPNWPAAARIWTQADGIKILGANISQHFDFIMTAGDFETDVISDTGPIVTNLANETETASFDIGIVDRNGRYIPFKNVPPLVAPIHSFQGITIRPLDRMSDITMNRSMTLISSGSLWDNQGNLLSLPATSSGCVIQGLIKITDSGDLFGYASCSESDTAMIVHVDKSGSESVGDWLKHHGVKNDLGNFNIAVNSVSEDGKTIVGFGDMGSVAVGGPASPSTNGLNGSKASAPAYQFIAHIP